MIEKPFGKRNRENYLRSLEVGLVKTPEYRKFLTYLSLIDVDKLQLILADMSAQLPQGGETKVLDDLITNTGVSLMEEDLDELLEMDEEQQPANTKAWVE